MFSVTESDDEEASPAEPDQETAPTAPEKPAEQSKAATSQFRAKMAAQSPEKLTVEKPAPAKALSKRTTSVPMQHFISKLGPFTTESAPA